MSCYKLYENEMKHLSEMVGAFIMQGSEEMYRFDIREISKEDTLKMIQKYYYSNTLPKMHSAEPSGLRCVSERTLCGT